MYKVGTETAASQRLIWSRTKKGKKLKTKPKATAKKIKRVSTKGNAVVQILLCNKPCKHLSMPTKQSNNHFQQIHTDQHRNPSTHVRNTPAFSKANTTDAATTPAANQRIERRAHKIERTLSTPAWRIINQAAPSSK